MQTVTGRRGFERGSIQSTFMEVKKSTLHRVEVCVSKDNGQTWSAIMGTFGQLHELEEGTLVRTRLFQGGSADQSED